MIDLTSAATTTLIGMLGVVIGASISNYVNQRLAAKSARRDLLFKKKVDYFDKVVGVIEYNLKLYTIWIRKLGVNASSPQAKKALKELRELRKKFEIATSALYLDVETFSPDIRLYVAIEKQIFATLARFSQARAEQNMDSLRKSLHNLNIIGNSIIRKMRLQLARE